MANFGDDWQRLLPAMRAFALTLCRDRVAAEDLVQDTALKAWVGRNTFQTGTNLKSWLFTLMRHAFYAQYKANRMRAESLDDESFPDDLLPADIPRQEATLTHDDANRLLDALPPEQRAAIALVAVAGLSVEEAAQRLDVEPGTIKSRVSRGRARIAELIQSARPLAARGITTDHIGEAASLSMPTLPAVASSVPGQAADHGAQPTRTMATPNLGRRLPLATGHRASRKSMERAHAA